jgi:hypothetical protein
VGVAANTTVLPAAGTIAATNATAALSANATAVATIPSPTTATTTAATTPPPPPTTTKPHLQQLHLPRSPAARRKVVKAPRSGKAENIFNSMSARLDILELEESTLRRYVNTTTKLYNAALVSLLKDAGRRTNDMKSEMATTVKTQERELLEGTICLNVAWLLGLYWRLVG